MKPLQLLIVTLFLGTLNFGSNKEYAQKTYKAFEHLFYLLKWDV